MIAYRQRGLINFYELLICVFAVGLLFVMAAFSHHVAFLTLLPEVNLMPYAVASLFGVLASSDHLRSHAASLHQLTIGTAVQVATKETLYVAACIFTLMFITKDVAASRMFFGSYLLLLWVMLSFSHRLLPALLVKLLFPSGTDVPTLFVNLDSSLESLQAWVQRKAGVGIKPVGLLSDTEPTRAEKLIAPYAGPIDRLEEMLRERRIGQVILLGLGNNPARVERMIAICEHEGCRFLVHNDYASRFARHFRPLEEGGHHFLALQNEPLEDPLNRGAKRLLDIAVSLPVVLFIIPPLCLMVWAVQRRQAPGPVFFTTPRGGRARQEFKMFKFRSMYAREHDINKQATSGDARIYPFGRFMRKSSLDEFPQFINVLIGDMSVVGPRPHLPKHDEEFSEVARAYRIRTLVKPGITGLAQVNGFRGEITDPEKLHRRVYWDLYYVANWSLWLDVRLIFRTAWQVFFPPGSAY